MTGCSRIDASMEVHQATKLSNCLKASHDSVKRVRKHLLGTSEEVLTCVPDVNKGLEVFADADVGGGFDKL